MILTFSSKEKSERAILLGKNYVGSGFCFLFDGRIRIRFFLGDRFRIRVFFSKLGSRSDFFSKDGSESGYFSELRSGYDKPGSEPLVFSSISILEYLWLAQTVKMTLPGRIELNFSDLVTAIPKFTAIMGIF